MSEGRRVLESLPTRSRTTGDKALARSRLVRRLRIALPTLAVILVIAFMLNTRSNQVDQAFLEDFEDISAAAEELRIANPHFEGIGSEGAPYEITAAAAKQQNDTQDLIELDKPRAVQGIESEQTIVNAQAGLFRRNENILELRDGVTVEHSLGAKTYVLETAAATVSVKDEMVVSDGAVSGRGSDGATLSADRMLAYNGEGRVVFEGNVRMRIYPDSAEANKDETESEKEPQDQL